jgi:TetR/AcrR family fatty acid metabolism transcriptional regulator
MQDRTDAILDAAKSVFAESGFAGASIADIARRAGVSDGLVYRYFENKRDLLFHVLRAFYQRIIADLQTTVLREPQFEARVASDYQGSAIQALNRTYTSILIRIVDAAVAAGEIRADIDPRLLRDVIFGAIEHRAWRIIHGRGGIDPAQTART